MNQTILEEKVVTYDSFDQISSLIKENFSKHFLFVRHTPKEHTLIFKKLPTPSIKL